MSNPRGNGPPPPGTKPMEPMPPEVQAIAAARGTPFVAAGQTPGQSPAVSRASDGALPFTAPGTNGTGHLAGSLAFSAKNPPRQLASPGVLSGLPGFSSHPMARAMSAARAHVQPVAAPENAPATTPMGASPAAVTPGPATPPAVAPPGPITPPGGVAPVAPPGAMAPPGALAAPAPVSPPGVVTSPGAVSPPGPVAPPAVVAEVDSEPPLIEPSGDPSGEIAPSDVAVSRAGPAAVSAAGPAAGPAADPVAAQAGEHPLAATNSPWTQTSDGTAPVPLPAADVLPSAQLPSAQAMLPAEEMKVEAVVAAPEDDASSRTLMTVGLAIAAIALIALLAYFMTSSGDVSDDPTSVGGVEQRDYGDDPPPSTTASATAAPKPRPIPPPQALPNPSNPDDIYEGTGDGSKPAPQPADDFYDDL